MQTEQGAYRFNDIDECLFLNCQTERLGVNSTHTGVSGNYDIQAYRSTVVIENSRLWGGNFGSVAPGQSRQYGLYLDDSHVTFIGSRLFSFSETAILGANDSRITCDLQSRIDYKIKGDITIEIIS